MAPADVSQLQQTPGRCPSAPQDPKCPGPDTRSQHQHLPPGVLFMKEHHSVVHHTLPYTWALNMLPLHMVDSMHNQTFGTIFEEHRSAFFWQDKLSMSPSSSVYYWVLTLTIRGQTALNGLSTYYWPTDRPSDQPTD